MITLYDAARCPYCARIRIVLAEKGIPDDPFEIDLRKRPAWLYEKNPSGKVPVLEEDGWVLPESAVIAEFLNERCPEPPLWPEDPGERAAGRLRVLRFDEFSARRPLDPARPPARARRLGRALQRGRRSRPRSSSWRRCDGRYGCTRCRSTSACGSTDPRRRSGRPSSRAYWRGGVPLDVTLEEVLRRRDRPGYVVVDVRSLREYTGETVAPCDPRAGRIPGAAHLDLHELMGLTAAEIEGRLGSPNDVELVTYCHSGQRSELAAEILGAAGYRAANYRGSWHEWSRDETLPAESG